ncbi:MAG: recombination regulator RecX [Gammaproteobacteria bacterium]|nr:recombination regulator RecX [Gammaproteobacteria bacterium]
MTPDSDTRTDLVNAGKKALDLLARREHSTFEIVEKLRARGFSDEIISVVVEDLQNRNYLSDRRFAETFVEQRLRKGRGERSIRADLNRRGINAEDTREALVNHASAWSDLAISTLLRKIPDGFELPEDRSEAYRLKAKYSRFLQSRGFSTEQIKTALAALPREKTGIE